MNFIILYLHSQLIGCGCEVKMLDSAEDLGIKHENSKSEKEDSEYVRLVITDEASTSGADLFQPPTETRKGDLRWWSKTIMWCSICIIIILIFIKWGVPFLFEKVCHLFQLSCGLV